MDDDRGSTTGLYRKLPSVVEAIRYQPGKDGNCIDICEFVGGDPVTWLWCEEDGEHIGEDCDEYSFAVETVSGEIVDAMPGDWIVKQMLEDGSTHVWPVAAVVFSQTYVSTEQPLPAAARARQNNES